MSRTKLPSGSVQTQKGVFYIVLHVERDGKKKPVWRTTGLTADERNRAIIEELREAGLSFEATARQQASEALAGKSFVVSGKFSIAREELKAMIESHGGKNLSAVSGNVDYLVAGEKMGPEKRKKAEKLGIRILSEEEFMALIAEGEAARPMAAEAVAQEAAAEEAGAAKELAAEEVVPAQPTTDKAPIAAEAVQGSLF